jgi:uncharacterized protein YbjT (DUF2867 family)
MICITGASGTLGSEVVAQLESAGVPFRAAHYTTKGAQAARARGREVVVIDYARPATLQSALQGCDTLFLLGPNVPEQTRLELNAVHAARAAGVRHIVKQSVLGAGEERYSLARIHRPVEVAIEDSGLDWTFLRPNSFMQNSVTYLGAAIRAESAFFTASGHARISHVDVRDVAAVVGKVLTERSHAGRTYTLTGPDAMTYDEVADELSKTLGRPIRHVSLSPAELRHRMLRHGMPCEIADRMLDLERYFREGVPSRITRHVWQVTGRAPGRFADYARETARTGAWDADVFSGMSFSEPAARA